jgi:hypothetical protein
MVAMTDRIGSTFSDFFLLVSKTIRQWPQMQLFGILVLSVPHRPAGYAGRNRRRAA